MTYRPPLPGFPAGFRWGVSTAAYQIEGAVAEDGRGASIWDTFSHTGARPARAPPATSPATTTTGGSEDVALMAGLGVDAYRFSIAWPRVQPVGAGDPNPAGLDFYDRLVDALLARRNQPPADALPLGSAAAAAGRGRLDEPGHGPPVRRLRRAGRRASRRPGQALDHAERTGRAPGLRLRVRRARAGRGADARRASGGAPPAARPRPRGPGAARARRRGGGDREQLHAGAGGESEPAGRRGRRRLRRVPQPAVQRPAAARHVPRSDRHGRRDGRPARTSGRPRGHQHADRRARRQLLQPDRRRRRRPGRLGAAVRLPGHRGRAADRVRLARGARGPHRAALRPQGPVRAPRCRRS